jgi:hypothetical protein
LRVIQAFYTQKNFFRLGKFRKGELYTTKRLCHVPPHQTRLSDDTYRTSFTSGLNMAAKNTRHKLLLSFPAYYHYKLVKCRTCLSCLGYYYELTPALGSTRTKRGGFCHRVCIFDALCQSKPLSTNSNSYLKYSLASVVFISIHPKLEFIS